MPLWLVGRGSSDVAALEHRMPARRLLVDIDLVTLGASLAKEEGRPVSEDEVRQWLLDAGFTPHQGLWIVSEPDLGQLDPSEVRSVEDAPRPE